MCDTAPRVSYYRLDGHEPVPCADLLEWARWFGTTGTRLARSQVGEIVVSTIFMGVAPMLDPPLFFETMEFAQGEEVRPHRALRSATWDQAMLTHEACVEALKDAAAAGHHPKPS